MGKQKMTGGEGNLVENCGKKGKREGKRKKGEKRKIGGKMRKRERSERERRLSPQQKQELNLGDVRRQFVSRSVHIETQQTVLTTVLNSAKMPRTSAKTTMS